MYIANLADTLDDGELDMQCAVSRSAGQNATEAHRVPAQAVTTGEAEARG